MVRGLAHPDTSLYKCVVTLSPTQEEVAEQVLRIPYNPSNTAIPIFMLSGTENDVITPENMAKSYAKVHYPKVMAIRKGAAHGDMLYVADGYVTAWFMWQLQEDEEAAKAFIGESPEIMNNELYQDQKMMMHKFSHTLVSSIGYIFFSQKLLFLRSRFLNALALHLFMVKFLHLET